MSPPRPTPTVVRSTMGPVLVSTHAITTAGRLEYDVPAGGVWIPARSLISHLPQHLYIGLRVTGGRMTLGTGPFPMLPAQLVVPPNTTIVLELDLEAPAPGGCFTPPSRLRIEFAGNNDPVFHPNTARISVPGATVDLLPGGAPFLAPDGNSLRFDATVTTVADAVADLDDAIRVAGRWQIERAQWGFEWTPLNLTQPPVPEASGFGLMSAGSGLTLSWLGVNGPLAVDEAEVRAHANRFEIAAQTSTRGIRQTLRDSSRTLGHVRFDFSTPVVITRFDEPRETRLEARAVLELDPPRPLAADGSTLRIESNDTRYHLSVADGPPLLKLTTAAVTPFRTALALSNALLTVEGPAAVGVDCALAADGTTASVQLFYVFTLQGALPILPDPYAANFEPPFESSTTGSSGQVLTGAFWTDGEEPTAFVQVRRRDGQEPGWLDWVPPGLGDHLDATFNDNRTSRTDVRVRVNREPVDRWMLDVSTKAGQFGLALGPAYSRPQGTPEAVIEDGRLHWHGLGVLVFSVPAIQWEPVADSTGRMLSVDDGGPSAFAVDTVRLVPVAPLDAAREFIDAYQQDNATLRVATTLPFGIRAVVSTDDGFLAVAPRPEAALEELEFDGLQAAPRLRLRSSGDAGMPGQAWQTTNVRQAGISTSVLAFAAQGTPNVHVVSSMFNDTFNGRAPRVPLHRCDWSGFGSSVFSHWINPNQTPPAVSQVRFDVLNGRTHHEVVQVSAILWPCRAFLVRTITLERQNNAAIVRHDSGWIASSDGRFEGAGVTFHRGLVGGYTRIREIRDTPRIVTANSATFQQVYFDADLEVEGITAGGRGPSVPVQRHVGYVQFLPLGTPAVPYDLAELIRIEGPAGGLVDCEIAIGAAGPRVTVSQLQVGTSPRPNGAPHFAVALHGTPQFPRAGDWTVVRTRSGQTTAVAPDEGAPFIRQSGQACRIADPVDLFNPVVPTTQYGILFSTDSNRVLFPCPEVRSGDHRIRSRFPARMADPYAYASASGLFPQAQAALEFPSEYALDFAAAEIFNQQRGTRAGELELAANAVMRLYVEGTTEFDAAANAGSWQMDSAPQTLFLDLLGFTKILSIRGQWRATSAGLREFGGAPRDINGLPASGPTLEVSQQLEQVKDILEMLQKLELPAEIDFSLRTEGSGLVLDASMTGHLARSDGSRIDTGMGKLSGMLRLGVTIRASISEGVQGCAYLEISGDFQQAVIPGLLYAGGHLRFLIGVFEDGEANIELTAGTMGSIGGSLIEGLIELEGTARYGYALVVPTNRLEQIRMGAELGLEVRAVLLSGLLAIKFTWDAGALMSLKQPDQTHLVITAHGSVSARVTAGWVVKSRRTIAVQYTSEIPRGVVLGVLAVTTFGVGPAAGAAAMA